MSDDHEWCRDVRRDEAVRAAEDAAAVPAIQHRDLPEIVADLRERVARLEAVEKQAAITEAMRCMTKMRRERDAARARVAELEAAAPPSGWLTAEEREALQWFCGGVWPISAEQARAIQSLLARSTPPKVKMPPASTGETPLVRDLMWGEAIRAAGGEVE